MYASSTMWPKCNSVQYDLLINKINTWKLTNVILINRYKNKFKDMDIKPGSVRLIGISSIYSLANEIREI